MAEQPRGKSLSARKPPSSGLFESRLRENSAQLPLSARSGDTFRVEFMDSSSTWTPLEGLFRINDFFHKTSILELAQQETFSDTITGHYKKIKIPLDSKMRIPSLLKHSEIRRLLASIHAPPFSQEDIKQNLQKQQIILVSRQPGGPPLLFRLDSSLAALKFVSNFIYYTGIFNCQLFTDRAIIERLTKRMIHVFCKHEIFVYWILHQNRRVWDVESLQELAKHLHTMRDIHMDQATKVQRAYKIISEYLRELPEYYEGTLTSQILKGNANPAINLDLDRARGRINNAVVGIMGKQGLLPIQILTESDKHKRDQHLPQKLNIFGITFEIKDNQLEIHKARFHSPQQSFPVRVYDVSPRNTWVRDIQQVFFLGNGFGCHMTMETIAKKIFEQYSEILPDFRRFSSVVARYRLGFDKAIAPFTKSERFITSSIKSLILPFMPLDRPLQRFSFAQSKASLATIIAKQKYTLVGGYELDPQEKIRIPKLEKICYPFGFFSDFYTASQYDNLVKSKNVSKFPKKFHELRGLDFIDLVMRDFNYLAHRRPLFGDFDERSRTTSHRAVTEEDFPGGRYSSPRRAWKLGPQGTVLQGPFRSSSAGYKISQIRAGSGDSEVFHDVRQVLFQEAKEVSVVQKPGHTPVKRQLFDSSSNSEHLMSLVDELNRGFHERDFQEIGMFFLEAKARFEQNEVVKQMVIADQDEPLTEQQACQLLDQYLQLERLRMEIGLDIYQFVQNVGHKEGALIRDSYFRRTERRKLLGLPEPPQGQEFGRYSYILYKANTESQLPSPRRSILAFRRSDAEQYHFEATDE